MPIHVHLHDERCLRVNRIFGAIGPAHFRAMAAFYATRRELLARDLISLVDEEVEVSAFSPDDLADLRQLYRDLQVKADFMVQRRSAWICPSVSAWPILETWLEGRHARDGQGTELCLVAPRGRTRLVRTARDRNRASVERISRAGADRGLKVTQSDPANRD